MANCLLETIRNQCKTNHIVRIFKCYDRQKEWEPRRKSVPEGLRVPPIRVLRSIKRFGLDTSVREAAWQLDLSYNTMYDLFDLFRQAITGSDVDIQLLSLVRLRWMNRILEGEGKETVAGEQPGRSRCFGILECGGKVRVEVVQNVTGETLSDMAIKKVK